MSSHTMPKMSLEAMYDDLCRYTKVLTAGSEKEFIMFAEGQKNLRRKLQEHSSVVEELKNEIEKLNREHKKTEFHMNQMKDLLENEIMERKRIRAERDALHTQVQTIKEVIFSGDDAKTKEKFLSLCVTCPQKMESQAKLATIEESYGSLLSQSDGDETDDNLDINVSLRRRKRRSKSGRRSSSDQAQKKKKSEEMETLSEELEEAFNIDLKDVPGRKSVNFRSSSEPNTNLPDIPTPRPVHRSDSDQVKSSNYDFRISKYRTLSSGTLPGNTPTGRYSTGGKLSRTHAFVQKTIIRQEKCYPCGKQIKFCNKALKCSDCRITSHPECKDKCPLPCIPVTFTPTKDIMGTLADYTSNTAPMIPSIIVQCVNEIECRGLNETGLYRVPGSEGKVKELKEKLLKRQITTLSQVNDIHTLCGTVKSFLHSLRDSLISRMMWRQFVDAAEHRDEELSLNKLCEAVIDLPQPNKETLAFLILHLQRIAETPGCKMPKDNLAKVFGPTIVGYSEIDPSHSTMLTETSQQEQVMKRLLSITADFWQNLLSLDVPEVFHPQIRTPEITPGPISSRLGPMSASGQRPRNIQVARTTLTPRNAKHNTKTGRRQFFPSPLTK
ncbi:hypothetical protein JTE90_023513 [Oedothorax gibbosus]|uniref:Rac GTPase-activating protein 1 n=1 Tax=Oedothorax gibbosus TaxID=931172 RepID=A0AAV6VQ36_9ARAC|nr:hypothetical protein JTE90_023513 [Oedothorax gibbosus]